jgi:hypothetical protein
MGCHPVDTTQGAASGTHDISFYCDDVKKTVAELKKKGVEFTKPVVDYGYGVVTYFKAPGGLELQLYQPKYEKNKPQKHRTTEQKKANAKKKGPQKRRTAEKRKKR